MSETINPLSVRDFIGKYISDEKFFESLPEFSFIKPVASKVKTQNCFCGLSEDMNRTTLTYNEVVNDLGAATINNMKSLFNTDKICFSIQTQNSYSVKCY